MLSLSQQRFICCDKQFGELQVQGMKYVATFKNNVTTLSSKASTARQGNCVVTAIDCVATIRT